MTTLRQRIFLLAVMLFGALTMLAQERRAEPRQPVIRVSGDATIQAKPDQARIDIGVVTQGASAQSAAADNAQQLDAALAALRKVLGPNADIKTISYSVTPNYRYPRQGGKPEIAGYTASNTVEVRINSLADVGKVIDAATQSGANTINSIQFTLQHEETVRAQALREAAVKARAKADALASALGVKIARILSLEEGEAGVIPPPRPMMAMRAEAAGAPTPIESGTIEVRATVTLTVEIAQ